MSVLKQYRWHFSLLVGSLLLVLVGCGDPPPVDPPGVTTPKKGQTDFSTTDQGSGYAGGMGSEDGRNSAPGASPPPSADASGSTSKQGAPGSPPSGRTGEVEEADLYRVSGNHLFYLNTYKGLTLFDLTDTRKPKKLANLPVFGYPIEMFVEGKTAYVLVKDALYMLRVNGKFQFHRRHVSQLISIDISRPNAPRVLQRLDIQGSLREGVSRKIEDTIYVVSYTPRYYWWGWSYERTDQKPEQATVYSFNIKDPRNIRKVQSLELIKHPTPQPTPPGGTPGTTTTNGSRSFSGVTIAATSNTLLVGERWRYYKYSGYTPGQCSTSENHQETVLSVIDISDATGKIHVHTRFKVRGDLSDQFKQTYIYDKKSNTGTYLGIFQRREWKYENCRSTNVVKNTLVSIDISNGANPVVLDELVFGKPNETVRGSLFDRDRKVAYAITARQIDPLYAISFKDPARLEVLSAVDGLSGDINVFRFIGEKKFLMGIGRDNSGHCTGFQGNDTRRSTQMAVSIIDVRDLTKVRLVQRKCVEVNGARWTNSAINWNLDQAHKMLGMYSDGNTNLVTLPVSFYVQSSRGNRWWWSEYKSAIGIMSWDLSKYDDTKDEKNQSVLENVATMLHPKGAVKRTIITKIQGKRTVINLSDTHMSLIDLQDLRKPSILSTFEIAPYVRSVYRFDKYIVERVSMGTSSYYAEYNEFRVKALGKGDINDAPHVASFIVGKLQKVVRWNNLLLLFRYHLDVQKTVANKRPYYDHQKTDLLIYDLNNPSKPKERGAVTLPFPFVPNYYFYCGVGLYYEFGWYGYYGRTSWVRTRQGIASLYRHYNRNNGDQETRLMFLDLRNPDKPSYVEKTVDTYNYKTQKQISRYYYDLVSLDGDRFYINSRTFVRTIKKNDVQYNVSKFYAQPYDWRGMSWQAGPQVNVPGRLVKAFRSGKTVRLLTQDYAYIRHPQKQSNGRVYYRTQTINRLFLLEHDAKVARLEGFQVFKSWHLRNMIVEGEKLYISAGRDWYYMTQNANDGKIENKGDFLLIFDLKGGAFKQLMATPTRTYNMQLMGVKQGRLFINLRGEGLLVTDIRKPASPKGLHFERTLGWLTHIEFDGDYALAAAGHFGIYNIDMTKTTIPPL